MRCFLLFIAIHICLVGQAQEFQNSWSYRNIAAPKYFRVQYENDLAFGTDYYFTQGVHFELVSPGIGRFPTKAVLLHPKGSATRYGIGLESAGYTPTSIFANNILYGDRPFAGMAYLKAFSLSLNEARRERYTSTLTVGLMGPAAGGYEIQAFIHRQTGNADPIGWKHQVGNALILNYELNYERALFARRRFLLTATGTARAGTYSIKAAIGGVLMAGIYDYPFVKMAKAAKLKAYLYAHPQLDFVLYDATLEGGLFTNNSPYVIEAKDMLRSVFRFDGGLRFGYMRACLSIYARYVTKEFGTGLNHATGGLELALTL